MATTTEGNVDGFLAFKKAKEAAAQKSDSDETIATTQDSDDGVAADDTIVQDKTEDTDEEDSTEGVQDQDTEQESTEEESEDTEAAPGEDETEGDEPVRLDPEVISELAKAYAEELLSTEELKKRVDAAVETQVKKQAAEQQFNARAESEVQALIEQGNKAVDGMFGLLEAAQEEFGKAGREEDFDSNILKAEDFGKHLDNYGMAIVAEVKGRYNRALDRTVLETLNELPTLSQEQANEVSAILQTAKRMEGDGQQAPQAAYFVTNSLVRFLLKTARDVAILEERERVQNRQTVARKVTDPAIVKAAAAKLAKQQGKTPPKTPPGSKTETDGDVSEEAYVRAKKEGRFADAQRIVDRMSRQTVALSR